MFHRHRLLAPEWGALDDTATAPVHFEATGTLDSGHEVRLEIVMEARGEMSCRGLAVTQHNGTPITTDLLRKLPVAQLASEAVAYVAQPYTLDASGVTITPVFPGSDERAELYERFAKNGRRPRRGSPITDDNLRQVSTIYQAAVANGDPPTQSTADALHVSRSTASRWIAGARKRGLLGPAIRGRAGEA